MSHPKTSPSARFAGLRAAAALGAAFLSLVLASPALGQLKSGFGVPLSEAETKAALLGIDMEGYMQGYPLTERMFWRECIQPDGETLYETPGRVLRGKLLVAPDGMACFSYEDDDYSTISCFTAYRSGDGLRFESESETLFVTTRIERGVKSCRPHDLIG